VHRAQSADPSQPFGSASTQPTSEAQGFQSLGLASTLSDVATCLDDCDEASTTHLIIIDARGNIVCATQSLGLHFGSAVVAPGTGFLLNDAMNNLTFNTPSSVNYAAPGKWPRSTMAPTIVLKDDKPMLVIGAPGGQRIPTGVLQVMLDVVDFHRPLDQAIVAPRFHLRRPLPPGNEPNVVDIDHETDREVETSLKKMGWKPNRRPNGEFYFGAVNAALIRDDGTFFGVADQRRTGDADGN
jgi:gamma-glutamyltranspeptidase/glutathione hydrolase